jgi:hypothetical protein
MGSLRQRVFPVLCSVVGWSALAALGGAQVPVKKIQIGDAARKLQVVPAPALQTLSAISAISEVHLLRLDHVQEELELVAEQREKLEKLSQEHDDQARQSWDALRDLPMQERLKKSAEIRRKNADRLEEFRKQALDVLLPHQQEKLKQIVFRMQAQSALANPRLLDQLGLDAEQKKLLQQLRDELAAKTRQLQREMVEKSLEVLTPEQRQQLKDVSSH